MQPATDNQSAVVLLSGGLDSATILAVALSENLACHCLSFDYGQRNAAELAAAKKLAEGRAASHTILPLPLAAIGGSSLTSLSADIPKNNAAPGIPSTYVPARNTIFLAYALALAEVKNAGAIFIGVNSVDYSSYPDCRPEFIAAFQRLADLATRASTRNAGPIIRAPLQNMPKSAIITWGTSLGVDYAATVTCYDPVGPEGLACGECDSCRLRKKGFAEAGVADPTRYA